MNELQSLSKESLDQEESFQFQDYWQVVKKRKWIILSIFIVVIVSVAFHTHRLRLVYKATSRILIEVDRPNILSIEDILNVDASSYEYVRTQFEILKSRKLINKVIEVLDLQKSTEFFPKTKERKSISVSHVKKMITTRIKDVVTLIKPKEAKSFDETAPVGGMNSEERQRELLYQRVVSRLEVRTVGDSRLIDISFTGYNPIIITKIVNTLTRLYIEQNLESRIFASEDASRWLDQKLQTMQKSVEESEKALQSYSREAGAVSLEHKEQILDKQIAELNSAVIMARRKRITLETLHESAKNSELAGSLTQIVRNPLVQNLSLELAKLNKRASERRNRYGPKHPKIILIDSQVEEITRMLNLEIQKIHDSIWTDLQLELAGEQSLLDAIDELQEEAAFLQEKYIKYGVLKRQSQSNRHMFDLVLHRLKETDLSQGFRTNNIRLVDEAVPPLGPFKPDKKKNLMLGMVFGLLGGFGLAFLIENLDNSVKEPDEIMTRFGIPFLGLVGNHTLTQTGTSSGESPSLKNNLITLADPSSNISESLRTIRTNILFSADEKPQKVLMITSALPSEGKTTVASNLAVVMASLGERVLLIDADLRRPSVHKIFSTKKTPGLSGYLVNQNDYEEIVIRTAVENLTLIPSGIIPPNPSELLSHPQLLLLLNKVGEEYDRIIIDTPPVASVSDPMIISKVSDATILVVRSGDTARDTVKRAVQQLMNVQANLMGAILNAVDFSKDSYYYQYYYKHYYYREDKEKDDA